MEHPVQTPFIREIKENRSSPQDNGNGEGALVLRDEKDNGETPMER
jgi:hypothetical protein